ncbi:hypothetical protein [Hansschlegelia zhihuaiae]|uniref:Uncharacterized protein n=1 Tax=Hansschlegelia zhihuaiae TaxID=405005 RepID=A0A4Q0M472_9HYPH|nr:hypothetical protein [Hansschlegelia zhihuaiae]RXF67675.1 hypothetical protein EK403_20950 [Hansschlegelia zhihuaiae]
MKVLIILPETWVVEELQVEPQGEDGLDGARAAVGLQEGFEHVEFGPGLHMLHEEDSLKADPATQSYFMIGRKVYAGRSVIYATDDVGEIVDMAEKRVSLFGVEFDADEIIRRSVTYPQTALDLEAAIQRGEFDRPTDGAWSWSPAQAA